MTDQRLARTVLPLFGVLLALVFPAGALAKSHNSGASVEAGAAVLDGTYHVGSSAGQYASTRDPSGVVGDQSYGAVDPNAQSVKNQASYGVQSRESVRALVVKGSDGNLIALVSDDHYIPQDALWRRTAQILQQKTNGAIGLNNLTMTITHNHSSPSYSSLDWGVWSFQDVFDFRFFDYYANQNAAAVLQALHNLQPVRVSATVVRYDAVQKNPMGPGWADDGSPDGFPRPHTDHDLSVVLFQNKDTHQNIATLFNWGQHPEDLEGYDLISGEFPAEAERFIDRTLGGVSILTQNATGTSEVEEDRWHPVHMRELVDHEQYGQMEWAARQLASAVIDAVRTQILPQRPNPDTSTTPYGGTSYASRFVPWMYGRFPVSMEDRWFSGPVSHPYPGVSSCRTDPALQGNPRLPVVGLPDCQDVPAGDSLSPVISQTGLGFPGISTDTFEQLGIPIPENYSAPSTGALEDTTGVHMQAFRLGDILFTVCSCEQWVEQSYNIKTRTDQVPGNEYLGYDPTAPVAKPSDKVTFPHSDPTETCMKNNDGTYGDDVHGHPVSTSGTGTWNCTIGDYPYVLQGDSGQTKKLPDSLVEHMRAQILNDASGWDDPNCHQLGCGYEAESESTNLAQIRGNFTHDDTTVGGGHHQSARYAKRYGYKLTVTVGMANDYNGYIASYREFMDHDHYRKALTGWGPHSSDYYATRLVEMGHALHGDSGSQDAVDQQSVLSKASAAWKPFVAKEVADQRAESLKVRAVSATAAQAVKAYELTLPNDGGVADIDPKWQPKDIQRFDATTFTWDGGNNYTDNPNVVVQRLVDGNWVDFADQSGEVPVTLKYPQSSNGGFDPSAIAQGVIGYHAQPQEWQWTATFEAFVVNFPDGSGLVDPQGNEYWATPPGTYRFFVTGKWRKNNADVPYERESQPFTVSPWSGITVEHAGTDSAGHVVFDAGPTHQIAEQTVRNTQRPPFNPNNAPYTFTIGPVDFPDSAKDQAATGARFLNKLRGYSGVKNPDGTIDVEHYCVDCTFRPWLDATNRVVADVVINGQHETVQPDANGRFVTSSVLLPGQTATVTIQDAWGDYSGTPATVTR